MWGIYLPDEVWQALLYRFSLKILKEKKRKKRGAVVCSWLVYRCFLCRFRCLSQELIHRFRWSGIPHSLSFALYCRSAIFTILSVKSSLLSVIYTKRRESLQPIKHGIQFFWFVLLASSQKYEVSGTWILNETFVHAPLISSQFYILPVYEFTCTVYSTCNL